MIYHIVDRGEWEAALKSGEYRPSSLADEGFIHCSTRRQVVQVADFLYHGQAGLILLEIDPGFRSLPRFDMRAKQTAFLTSMAR